MIGENACHIYRYNTYTRRAPLWTHGETGGKSMPTARCVCIHTRVEREFSNFYYLYIPEYTKRCKNTSVLPSKPNVSYEVISVQDRRNVQHLNINRHRKTINCHSVLFLLTKFRWCPQPLVCQKREGQQFRSCSAVIDFAVTWSQVGATYGGTNEESCLS
jgi:hypothetical protein